MEIPGFVLLGAIRSKKTSQQIVTIPSRGAHKCRVCGKMPGFPKIIPSEAHKLWHSYAMEQCIVVKAKLRQRGIILPIVSSLSVEAIFYQDANRADATGLYESLADLLQDAGIIQNDKLIEDWDGSRRKVDKGNPRVEVYLTVVEERLVQQDLNLAGSK
jgi:hypothetical protein